QRLPGLAASVRVEAGRRLVEEDQLRVADEREPEVEPTALAAREASDELVALLPEADQLDHLVDRARLRVVAGEEAQVLRDAQRLVHGRGLEHDADPVAPGTACPRRVDAAPLTHSAVAPGARRSSGSGSTPTGRANSAPVSRARSSGLVRIASGWIPSAARRSPSVRAARRPSAVSGLSSSGSPSTASAWRTR